jgi:hypothetical protein
MVTATRPPKGRPSKYPWLTMKYDETFLFFTDDNRPMDYVTAYIITWQANKRYEELGLKFEVKRYTDKGEGRRVSVPQCRRVK